MPQIALPVLKFRRIAGGLPRRAVGPTLAHAWVLFHTNDEDKDPDTDVWVTVTNDKRTVVAHVQANFGKFPDHSDRGPYSMIVRPEIEKRSLQHGGVTIRIQPNGNDTWRFNMLVVLRFSDNSTLAAEVPNLELTQDRDQKDSGFDGILRDGPDEIGPTLQEASISFHTNDDDKDPDAKVTVTVKDFNNNPVALLSDTLGHFDDHSDNGPFRLPVLSNSSREQVRRGRVEIRIDPHGNDTWKFNFDLLLTFSDGTILGAGVDRLELSEDNQVTGFGIEELVG